MKHSKVPEGHIEIFRPYITIGGKRRYRPNGKMWRLVVKEKKDKE